MATFICRACLQEFSGKIPEYCSGQVPACTHCGSDDTAAKSYFDAARRNEEILYRCPECGGMGFIIEPDKPVVCPTCGKPAVKTTYKEMYPNDRRFWSLESLS